MNVVEPLRIEGLKEFQRALKQAEDGLQKQLRLVLNDAANIVVRGADPFIPRRSGRLESTLRASSSQRDASVKLGSAKVPYAGWIEFGGAVGRNKSVRRPFVQAGRSLYPAVKRNEDRIATALEEGLTNLARESGLA